jgi:hypothetical protein
MIFHDILSEHFSGITPLAKITRDNLDNFIDEWQHILNDINYYSIFHLAREIFWNLSLSAWGLPEALMHMVRTAHQISQKRTALRHDLMGRVYHRLLSDAKYLGTYYTSIPAATLLLKLSLRSNGWAVQWHDPAQVGGLRIADLSCGTGTLLMAAADTLVNNHVSAAANLGKRVQLKALHQQIAEAVLFGYDVLASAIHLTASTLALRTPEVPFRKMNLFALPLGGPEGKLGSIEFLRGRETQIPLDLFGALPKPQQVTGQVMEELTSAPLPDLDLCVMNPPFVRSVIGNLLFGSLPEKERKPMQQELQTLVRQTGVLANITAGLGSVFVAIGDRFLKEGGRIALILPKALLSGVAWQETRNLINQKYVIEYMFASQDPERWNFSDSTDLSEVMLIARKRPNGTKIQDEDRVTVVNLWRNPANALEALAVAYSLEQNNAPDITTEQGALEIRTSTQKLGEAVSYPWGEFKKDWMIPATFAQSDLIRVGYHLRDGEVWIPGYGVKGRITLCPLGELAAAGPDGRDIHDGFEATDFVTAYPALWGHKSEEVRTLALEPNKYLAPLPKAKPGRPLRKLTDLWHKSGTLLVGARIWLKTHRAVAVRVSQPVLSNVWWSLTLQPELANEQSEKILALWLNSTLSLFLLLISRQETRGAWVQFKKPILAALPVLDLRTLSSEQEEKLVQAYNRLAKSELRPLPEMDMDEIRAEIDRTIADALGLPDFSVLRKLLAREPVVCMERI